MRSKSKYKYDKEAISVGGDIKLRDGLKEEETHFTGQPLNIFLPEGPMS